MKLSSMLVSFSALTLAAAPLPALAEAGAAGYDVGLTIGQTAPAIVELNSQGVETALKDVMGAKGVTLAFVRSADWCPFCKNQMIAFNEIAAELEASGYPLVVLSYDSPEKQAEFIEKQSLTYAFLSDEDSSVIKSFGLLNTDYKEGSFVYGVPHPAIYKISKSGKILGKLMEEGYKDRPANDAVVELVSGAAG